MFDCFRRRRNPDQKPIEVPVPKPEVKDWIKDYSKEEKLAVLSSKTEPPNVAELKGPETGGTKEIDTFISQLYTAASNDNDTGVLIVVKSNNTIEDKIEFSRVAAKILREFVDADVSIHSSGKEVELQCTAAGSEDKVVNAINALCECVAFKMKEAYGSKIKALVFPSLISKHASLKTENIIRNRRKFVMSRIS